MATSHVDLRRTLHQTARFAGVLTDTKRRASQITSQRKFLDRVNQGEVITLRDLSRIVGQQNSHRLSHYPTPFLICATSGFLSQETTRPTKWWGVGPIIWDQPIVSLPEELIGDLTQLLRPRMVGDYLRQNGPIVAAAIADSSGFRVGYQITRTGGETLRGSLPLLPKERTLHHTVQKSVGTNHVAMTAIRQLDLRGSAVQPAVVLSGNDNTAALKNIDNPGNKSQMVLHRLGTLIEARKRNVIATSDRKTKYYMDHLSNVDYDGRRLYRSQELGLQPQLVQLAAKLLGCPWSDCVVDMMACRATRQSKYYVARFPDGDPDRFVQCDASTYNLGSHPDLKESDLYFFPPEIMPPRVVMQIMEQQRPGQKILLVYPQWRKGHSWGPLPADRIQGSVFIPLDNRNWVHPGGVEQTDVSGQRLWPLIMSLLYREEQSRAAADQVMPRQCFKLTATTQDDELYYHSESLPTSPIDQPTSK